MPQSALILPWNNIVLKFLTKRLQIMNPFAHITNEPATATATAAGKKTNDLVSPRDQTTQFSFLPLNGLSVNTTDEDAENVDPEARRISVGKANRSPMHKRRASGAKMAGMSSNWDLQDDKPTFMQPNPSLKTNPQPATNKLPKGEKDTAKALLRAPFNSPKFTK